MSRTKVEQTPDEARATRKKHRGGRPPGVSNKVSPFIQQTWERAHREGKMLPHEFLWHACLTGELPPRKVKVPKLKRDAKGIILSDQSGIVEYEIIEQVDVLDTAQRLECARAAAPYYAPRLNVVQVVESLTDSDLMALILADPDTSAAVVRLAAQASGGASNEGVAQALEAASRLTKQVHGAAVPGAEADPKHADAPGTPLQ